MENYLIVAILGALARLLDIPLMVMRTNLMVNGKELQAGIIGVLEQFIYISIVFNTMQKALQTGGNAWFISILILSLGFGISIYIGGKLNRKLYPVKHKYRFLTCRNDWKFADYLRENGYTVTGSISYGLHGKEKEEAVVVITSSESVELMSLVNAYPEDIFHLVEPVHNMVFLGTIYKKG